MYIQVYLFLYFRKNVPIILTAGEYNLPSVNAYARRTLPYPPANTTLSPEDILLLPTITAGERTLPLANLTPSKRQTYIFAGSNNTLSPVNIHIRRQ
jgi:hypothetical protein